MVLFGRHRTSRAISAVLEFSIGVRSAFSPWKGMGQALVLPSVLKDFSISQELCGGQGTSLAAGQSKMCV